MSPFHFPQEDPTLIREIVEFHTSELGFSITELSDLMLMKPPEVRQEFTLPKTGPRRVA